MKLNKTEIVACIFIIIIFTAILFEIQNKLKEREKQFICKGHLRYWGSAFSIVKAVNRRVVKTPKKILPTLKSYFYDSKIEGCPSAKDKEYSYKIHYPNLQNWFADKIQIKKQKVLVFDGKCEPYHFINKNVLDEIAYRHFRKPHLLLTDGSVIELPTYKALILGEKK